MTKQSVETPEIETMGEVAMTKTEIFFENNGKRVAIAIFAILAITIALFSYKALVIDPTESKASESIYSAQSILEGTSPDYELALNGNDNVDGFLDIIENYGSTASGNLANHYAGICYMKLGDNANALKYLKSYKAQKGIPAQIINAQNIGLQGDIAVANGNYTEASALYTRASKLSDNPLTAPLYLIKAGISEQAAGNMQAAKDLYEQVIALYPSTIEARNADKYLGTIK